MSRRPNKYPRPVSEKFQTKARLRRIHQQLRDGQIGTFTEFKAQRDRILADSRQRYAVPDFAKVDFDEVFEEKAG